MATLYADMSGLSLQPPLNFLLINLSAKILYVRAHALIFGVSIFSPIIKSKQGPLFSGPCFGKRSDILRRLNYFLASACGVFITAAVVCPLSSFSAGISFALAA